MRRTACLALFIAALFAACQSDKSAEPTAPETQQPTAPPGIDSATGAPVRLPNPWLNKGCDLITDAEIQKLFGIEPKRDVLNTRSLSDQTFCLRSWMKPNWMAIQNANEKPGATYKEFKNTLVVQVLDYGTLAVAKEQYDMAKTTRKDLYDKEVQGVGEAALWSSSSNTLLVKKGHLFLSITLDYADTPDGNLAKAKDVAAIGLAKM